MPIIAYRCKCGNAFKKFFRNAKDATSNIECSACGDSMKRQLSASSFESKLIVDNGIQARQVEVNPDIIEINKERANKNYSED